MSTDVLAYREAEKKFSPGEKKSFFKHHLLPQMMFFTVGFPKGSFISVDVTEQCNLRCQHCYFFEQEQEGNLDTEGWERRILELKKNHRMMYSCTWIGGEPLLKRGIIEKCKHHFLHNLIVTNGTIPLPDWHDVMFHVSVDGYEAAHDNMRRQKGLYQLMKQNVSRKDLHVTAAMCVTSLNVDTVEDLLQDWYETTYLKGMMFDFYTPIEGITDDLWIGWERRDAILDRLKQLKDAKYGDFIAMNDRTIELMKSHNAKRVTDNCLFEKKGYSLTTKGEIKEKCMLGPKADCDRCGCVVPFYLRSRVEKAAIIRGTWTHIGNRFRQSFTRRNGT